MTVAFVTQWGGSARRGEGSEGGLERPPSLHFTNHPLEMFSTRRSAPMAHPQLLGPAQSMYD